MARPLSLDRPAARDPELVGAKAALLATALAEGLPVLRGAVLPASASAAAIGAGADALAENGRPQAYLTAASMSAGADVLDALASVARRVVVRSSTPLDLDGTWSGAFASYLDVAPEEIGAAVSGCWASAFTRDALDRCEATGVDPSSHRVAVLVQPWVAFDVGGTAHLDPDGGDVRISAAGGGPHRVVGGSTAPSVVLTTDGRVDGDAVAPSVATAVAALARDVAGTTGVEAIEWGATDGRVLLLQIGPAAARSADRGASAVRAASLPDDVGHLAAIAAAFRGPLADAFVLPWALGADGPFDAPAVAIDDAGAAVSEIRALDDALLDAVWGSERADAAPATIADLIGGKVERALARMRTLKCPDPVAARRVIGLIGGVGRVLEIRGVLPTAESVWWLRPSELDAAITGQRVRLRGGPDRWEPFLTESTLALGTTRRGTPVADGVGAGRLHVVPTLRDIARAPRRAVLAATAPLPQLAPLLWHCAAFVARGGSAGAHLFEVARSLGVPAVVGVEIEDLGPPGSLVAVDGTNGTIASLSDFAGGRVRTPA